MAINKICDIIWQPCHFSRHLAANLWEFLALTLKSEHYKASNFRVHQFFVDFAFFGCFFFWVISVISVNS